MSYTCSSVEFPEYGKYAIGDMIEGREIKEIRHCRSVENHSFEFYDGSEWGSHMLASIGSNQFKAIYVDSQGNAVCDE